MVNGTKALAVAALACAALLGLAARETASATTEAARPVVFTSVVHGVEIYLADAHGKHERRLTNAIVGSRWPALAPDKKRIAVSRKATDGWHVLVMNLDGSGLLDVTGAARSRDMFAGYP